MLRKGGKILIPCRLLHFNEAIFGADVHHFRPERFEGREQSMTRGPSWRPFGGGRTKCPGYLVAKREIMLFVAMVLERFDLEMVGGPAAAVMEPDLERPAPGIANRKPGEDLLVRLTARHRSH